MRASTREKLDYYRALLIVLIGPLFGLGFLIGGAVGWLIGRP